ncbi:MAG: AzlC family ABC transporter permease [Pseudolabrys sp.]|nr:AzlC family ABC transporter permease [Pseudolabrys sp.]MCW5683982.1 AzlC family ABC transporter permease [Pseudolabrys sp.]
MVEPSAPRGAPIWSRQGWRQGFRLGVPVLAGMSLFGVAVGTTSARIGLDFVDLLLMNVFVYAGIAQMVAMEIWPQSMTWGAIAALTLVVAVVNSRLLLMSASLQPWFAPLPGWQLYPLLYYLTDPGWLISMRYRGEGGRDLGVHGATTVLFLLVWLLAVICGYFLGSLIANPQRYGLDLAMPVFFAVMLVPLWRGPRRGMAWAIAGAVALAVQYLVPGWWFIVAGSIAGAIAGGFLEPDGAAAKKPS